MAPATPAKGIRTPATPRTTRSKVAAHSNLAESSLPSTPGTVQAGKTANKAPMTTGKMGLLGKKPSKLFVDKETPMVKRMASFALPNIGSSKARVPSASSSITSMTTEKNNVQAFLRLRPSPSSGGAGANAGNTKPYIEIQGDKQVTMKAPIDPSRSHVLRQTSTYSFDRVFAPDAPQSDVFENTTLPMVEQVLHGQGGLLFSYGVSNSGKTYTMQGDVADGATEKQGMIPRAIQVVFDSIDGLACDRQVKPVRQAGVELPVGDEEEQMLGIEVPDGKGDLGDRIVKVDRNYSYAIFVSHVEVYNDKIFDLLESVPMSSKKSAPTTTSSLSQIPRAIPRAGGFFSRNMLNSDSPRSLFHKSPFSSSFGSRPSLAAAASFNGGSGIITRQALALKTDIDGGRYISGMKEIRVKSKEEALAVFMIGQEDRQVFGTLANRQSSRSHGVFTIKVVRIHNGAPNDADSATVSRLCMVDLAGSERNDKSQAEGERLKEACNINKSLFAVRTCLKTLRENQALMASRTLSAKRKPAHVNFKHVRLTEILESFFTGEGRVVMIVNVNPHDTGFQENSQIMEFSALATQVQTSALDRLRQPIMKSFEAMKTKVQHSSGSIGRSHNKITVILPTIAPKSQQPSSALGPETPETLVEMVEEDLEVVEVDADDDEDVESDALVDALIEELARTRMRLMQAEMLNALIEADVREEVVQEMHGRLAESDERWRNRLQEEVQAHEEKTDRKIDIMQRRLAAAQGQQISVHEASDDEDDDERTEEIFASAVDISVEASSTSFADEPQGSPTPKHAKWPEMLVPDIDISSPEPHAQPAMASSNKASPGKDSVYVEIVRQQTVPRDLSPAITVHSQSEAEEDDELALTSPGSTTALSAGSNVGSDAAEVTLDDVEVGNMMSFEDDEEEGEQEDDSDCDEASQSDNEDSEAEDEDEDEEEDEEEEEEVDNDSSFAVSNISISTVSSVPSTPVKRAAKPKTSTYSRRSTAPRSPAKAASQSPIMAPKRPARSRAATKSPQKPAARTPLSESCSQSHVVTSPSQDSPSIKKQDDVASDATPEQQVQASAVKKKRKLGKKVAILDDGVGLRDEGQFTVRRMLANGRA